MTNKTASDHSRTQSSRRTFLKASVALAGLSFFPAPAALTANQTETTPTAKSIIGDYGPWANSLLKDPPELSFRKKRWTDIEAWRKEAKAKAIELIASPDIGEAPKVTVEKAYQYDGLDIEELSWQAPYGHRTKAILLKPSGAQGPLPGILGLHDHGGNKYFGRRKITRTAEQMHPMMIEHQKNYYSGKAWANDIAKRGYVVLVHDTFTFASRRVRFADMLKIPWGQARTTGMSDDAPENIENIKTYNSWAAAHEHIMAKSLFCAGTTWPGVFLAEDRLALSILSRLGDVDAERLGCAGLSGGGLRTVYLGGLDERIKCAVCVGFMSTWSDFLLNKAYTHTWMTYTPLLPQYLDFPEILGLRAPLPTLTLNNNQDGLFTLPEMKRADAILQQVFEKAGAPEYYKAGFYPGPHKFDAKMQKDAFDWFDTWLK